MSNECDYKKFIVEMLEEIESKDMLISIYSFIIGMLSVEKK